MGEQSGVFGTTDVSIVSSASSGGVAVTGAVADDAAAGTTKPVAVGGLYTTSAPTYTTGDRTQLQANIRGDIMVALRGQVSGDAFSGTMAGPMDLSGSARLLGVGNYAWNGASMDRVPGDTKGMVVQPHALSGARWSYAAAASGIANTTTAVTVKAAAGASVRNYVTGLQIQTATLGGATEFAIRDGAGGAVLFRTQLQTTALPLLSIEFGTPLMGTANTLLEVVTLTAVTGGVYVNLQGFTGA